MNVLPVKKCSVKPLLAPLSTPFRTSLGQHDRLDNLLFVLELGGGIKGFGEAAVAPHITGETVPVTQTNLNMIAQELLGQDISDYLAIFAYLRQKYGSNPCAVAAVEMAVLDALTKVLNIPLWKFFGSNPAKITSDITIVIGTMAETIAAATSFYKAGFRTFKIKVGKDDILDLERVLAVKKITRNSPIIIDANQGFTAEQALSFIKQLKKRGVTPRLIEQPVNRDDWDGLKKVSAEAGIPVCADESAAQLCDVIRIAKERVVPVVNIKLMKFGLIQGREAALLCRANGIELMIGGMMETSLAMTAAAHLAAGLGIFQYIDLDTPFFLSASPRIGGLRQSNILSSKGVYEVARVKKGIGVDP